METVEGRASYYLLTHAPALARKFDEEIHVLGSEGIDWTALDAACFSHSEVVLAKAARDLWNCTGGVELGDLLSRLDKANFAALLEALRIHG